MKMRRTAVGVARARVAHVRGGAGFEIEALEAREAERPTVKCGLGVNADAPLAVGPGLIESDYAGIGFGDVEQKILVANAGEAVFLLGGGQAGKVIHALCFDAKEVAAGGER